MGVVTYSVHHESASTLRKEIEEGKQVVVALLFDAGAL
jgi:hypothetical protein